MSNETQTKLTKRDLELIEERFQQEAALIPTPPTQQALLDYELGSIQDEPTAQQLRREGYRENKTLTGTLDFITGMGRVLTLIIAEFIQAFAAIALAIVFILLEAERITAGVIALGQHREQAVLIALAFTVANAVLPIYRLRNVRGQTTLSKVHWTARGHIIAFWNRLSAKPQNYEVDVYHNPTLHLTEAAITWATLFLAFYAVLGPMLSSYEDLRWYHAIGAVMTESNITEMLGLIAGALLAVGGVFGVQSISHEIGVRIITDRPERISEILEHKRAEYHHEKALARERAQQAYQDQQAAYNAQIKALRDEITYQTMTAKVQDQKRKKDTEHSFSSNGHKAESR